MKHTNQNSLPNVDLSEARLEHCSVVPWSELKKNVGLIFGHSRPMRRENSKSSRLNDRKWPATPGAKARGTIGADITMVKVRKFGLAQIVFAVGLMGTRSSEAGL